MLASPAPQRLARRPRLMRPLALAALVLSAALLLAVAPAAPPRALAQDDAHLDTVQSEYHILLTSYYTPLDPVTLLNAAWDGATDYLSGQQVAISTPRPQFSGDDETTAFADFGDAWQALIAETADQADPEQIAFAADDAMANSLQDDHTGFIDPADYTALQTDVGGAQSPSTGLGIIGGAQTPHVITEVAPGGPADTAGVHPGDTITAVNGTDVTHTSGDAYLKLLHGDAGTTITLTVDRPNAGTLTIPVTIGSFLFPVFSSQILPGKIGYMKLRGFPDPWTPLGDGKTFPQELDAALASFQQAGVTTWVLDLRDNPGGSVASNEALVGRFLADGITAIATDARGDRLESLVDGHPFPQQEPLAVLVNGNSFSSSEVTASALHDAGRAVLVGARTGGALGSGLIFPLPDGAAVEVNAAQTTGGDGEQIDGVGVPVDIEADPPTAAQLAAGLQADPAIVAGVQAVQGQPVAPQPAPPETQGVGSAQQGITSQQITAQQPASTQHTLPLDQLQQMAAPYEPTAADVPLAPEITVENPLGTYTINTDDEWVNYEAGAPDAEAARALPKQRGWQGAVLQFFGENNLGAFIEVNVDFYATDEGAAAALASNDAPELLDPLTPPVQLGDGTVAYQGKWLDTGSDQLTWREGRVLFTVDLATVPGEATFDPLVQLAQTIDARWQAQPLP